MAGGPETVGIKIGSSPAESRRWADERGDRGQADALSGLRPVASFVSPTGSARCDPIHRFSTSELAIRASPFRLRFSVPPFVNSGLSVLSGTLCVFSPRVVASWHRRHLPRGSHAVQSSPVRSVAHGCRRLRGSFRSPRSRRRRSRPACSPRCNGATSARFAPGGPRRRPAIRASRTPSTSAWCNGGVWKTTDAGRTWKPIFDDQPTGSIGWVAVAPSDPEHRLRRQRRRPAAAGPRGRRRHLQVDRRRQDLDASRPARRAADSQDRRSTRRIPNRLFVAALGHPVRAEPGARHLPLDRRRQDVRSRPVQGREHRRQGRRHRSRRTPTSSTRRCGSSGRARGRTARGTAPTAACSSPPTAARPGRR